MANFFDQFDEGGGGGNFFDRFDAPVKRDPKIGQPEELTFAEKYIAPMLEAGGKAVGRVLSPTNDQGLEGVGISRGGWAGRLAKGASDPGVALVQLGANAIGEGEPVNRAIAEREAEYQAARKAAGSEGFDPLRMIGQTGISLMVPGAAAAGSGVARGALTGAGFAAANPVTDGGENFWKEKGKEVALGAVGGAVLSPFMGALARVVSPNATQNESLNLLRKEGVTPSVGQTLGGWANKLEEKAQSLPLVGSMIERARQRGGEQLESAAFRRAAEPVGETVAARGNAGIKELSDKIGAKYEEVLPKLSVNVLDDNFVQRVGSLRNLVQSLPEKERNAFDAVLAREIDGRVLPDGTLGGQALKDAWNALRDNAKKFGRSTDGHQQDLGLAFKQAFQELKDHVARTNGAADVSALKNADFAYANFKRLQRAASSIGADEGRFTPAQLQAAVKALDSSKDKARFAEGDALMQDLSAAGKKILTNKVPDSGSAGRMLLGLGVGGGALFSPKILAGMAAGAAAYTPVGQNALRALILKRSANAPRVANSLRQLANPAALAMGPLLAPRDR